MLQCEVIGSLGSDAEIKEFSGKKYVSMSVAHSESRKGSDGSRVDSTVWVSVLWYGEGGGLFQYLKKGTKVFVRGRLSVKTYTDRDNNTQCAINLNANEVQLCGIKDNSQQDNSGQKGQSSNTPKPSGHDDDDLPF